MLITCVRCTSVLDKSTVGGMEVNLCPSCGGLWLDRGELERLNRAPPAAVATLREALAGARPEEISATPTACPACPGKLSEVRLGNIHIDFCDRCRGVFLDKGELDAALASVRGTTVESVLTLAGVLTARPRAG